MLAKRRIDVCIDFSSLLVAICLVPSQLDAWPADPALNVPVSTAVGTQEYPEAISDGMNGAIVVWTDRRFGGYEIFGQRVLADGTPAWSENGISLCDAIGEQADPQICPDQQGGGIVAWADRRSGEDIYAQRVGPDGAVIWASSGVPVCAEPGRQLFVELVSDDSGGAIVVWQDLRSDASDIYAQRLSPGGAALWAREGVKVCDAPGAQYTPKVISDGEGGAIVFWDDYRYGSSDFFAQRLSSNGQALWASNGVAIRIALAASHEKVGIPDGSGGAFLAWQDNQLGDWEVFVQRISADGVLLWPDSLTRLCPVDGVKSHPSVTPDGTGGMIVSWVVDRSDTDSDIYGQRLSPNGARYWDSAGRPICVAAGAQWLPVIVSTGFEGSVVTWSDSRVGEARTYVQWLSDGGDPLWGPSGRALSTASGSQQFQKAVPSSSAVIVVWHDYRNAAPDVYADRAVLDLPTEVLVSVIEGVWEPDRVRLAWHVGLSPGTSVAVYRCSPVRDWTRLGDTRVDGTGKVEFLDEGVPRGATLGYRLGFIERSGEAFAGEVWVEVPASRLAIRGGIRQRTHRGPLAVECVLRDGNTASLDLVDPAGRLRASAQIEPLGPGTHTIGLSGTESLASGVYFLRLRQSGEETRARIVLVD